MKGKFFLVLTVLLLGFCGTLEAQRTRARISQNGCDGGAAGLTGVYRIDLDGSDKLYSVIEGASSNVPYGDQQQFFMDLAVRLTPPDLLAIECRGKVVMLGSSRSPRIEFQADGVTRSARNSDGQIVRTRIGLEREGFVFTSNGGGDNLSFAFTLLENNQKLRVTRRIAAKELVEPVVITTVYNKINDIARWDIYGEPQQQVAKTDTQTFRQNTRTASPTNLPSVKSARIATNEAATVREALDQWIETTNRRDINEQMSFYMPEVKAFYLTHNVPRSSVRTEKNRVFASAKSIDIRAAEPEIIFQDGGRTAIMRFRKKYNVVNGAASRRGEVIQELRWQRTNGDWKIFSERDIKVIS